MVVIEAFPVLALALCIVLLPLVSEGMPGGDDRRTAGRTAKDAPVAPMKGRDIRR
jgi:hypothetical protein